MTKMMNPMDATTTATKSRGIRRSWLGIGIAASYIAQGTATSVDVNNQPVMEETQTRHTPLEEEVSLASPNLSSSSSLSVDASILRRDRRARIARIRELAAVESNNQDYEAIFDESFEQMWRQMENGMSMSPVS